MADQGTGIRPNKFPGSVRKAREAIEARHAAEGHGILPSPTSPTFATAASPYPLMTPRDLPRDSPRDTPRDLPRDNTNDTSHNTGSQPTRGRPLIPAHFTPRRANPAGIGASISRPQPASRWPLQESLKEEPEGNNSSNEEQKEPRRPPGPGSGNVPSTPSQSKPKDDTSAYLQRPYMDLPKFTPPAKPVPYWEDDYSSANTPKTTAVPTAGRTISSSTTSSSVGSIPDFPLPIQNPGPRRSSNNAPPSSWRGGSAHYSVGSYVTPIPEESPPQTRTYNSMASSRVIPSSWGSDPGDYTYAGPMSDDSDKSDDDDEKGLVRQASVTKRQRPSITTIKSADKLDQMGNRESSVSRKSKSSEDLPSTKNAKSGTKNGTKGIVGRSAVAAGVAGAAVAANWASAKDAPSTEAATVFDEKKPSSGKSSASKSTPASSQESLSQMQPVFPPTALSPARTQSPVGLTGDARANAVLAGIKRAGSPNLAIKEVPSGQALPRSTFSSRHGASRRPPNLNLNGASNRETRSSMTSLPDLIRRATKLATSLDKGRTASRIDPDLAAINEKDPEKRGHTYSKSLQDMLASFPPPGLTPTGEHFYSPTTSQQSKFPGTATPSRHRRRHGGGGLSPTSSTGTSLKHPRSRICGLPTRIFLLLLITTLLLITAAVVLPLVLVVIPQHRTGAAAEPNCATAHPCANGGAPVFTNGACSCVCVNGYTGPTCAQGPSDACVASNISAQHPDAVVGSAIPRLLTGAKANFSVPLDASKVLAAFAAQNVSCSSQNSLVTFNGQTSSRRLLLRKRRSSPLFDESADDLPTPSNAEPLDAAPAVLLPRADTPTTNPLIGSSTLIATSIPSPSLPAITSNGIVMAPTATGALTSNGILIATPASSSPAAPATASGVPPPSAPVHNATLLDFGRVAVLYVLQQSGWDRALTAQSRVGGWLDGQGVDGTAGGSAGGSAGASPDKIDLGDGFEVDFADLSISGNNGGSTVGGRNGTTGTG